MIKVEFFPITIMAFTKMRILRQHKDLGFLAKSAMSLSVRIGAQMLGLGVAMMLTRIVSVDDYGRYSIIMAGVMLLAMPIKDGGPHLWARFTAAYLAKSEYGLLKGLVLTAFLYGLCVSAVLIALSHLILWLCAGRFTSFSTEDVKLALWIIPITGFIFTASGFLRGAHHVIWAQIPEYIVRPLLFMCILGFGLFVSKSADVVSVSDLLKFYIVSGAIALALGLALLVRACPKGLFAHRASFPLRDWGITLAPLLLSSGLLLVNQNADILMLGAMAGSAEAGLYQVASRASMLLVVILNAINAVVTPSLSKYHAEDNYAAIQVLIRKASLLITALTLPLIIIVTVGAPLILQILFGADYAEAGRAFVLLGWAQAVNALAGPVGLVLIMTGHQKLALYGILASTVVNLVFNFILIPQFGINGAAFATGLSFVVWNVVLSIFVWRKLGLNCSVLPFGSKVHER
jgi:O-antigen/teichoic acid export membrane protein